MKELKEATFAPPLYHTFKKAQKRLKWEMRLNAVQEIDNVLFVLFEAD